MFSLRKQMKNVSLVLLLLASLLLFPFGSQAAEVCYSEEVTCFTNPVADAMIVAIEKLKFKEQQVSTLESGTAEQQVTIGILNEQIVALRELIEILKAKDVMNKQMGEAKDKACAEQIKAATPTFTQNMGKYSTGAVIGAVLTAVVILLL